MKELPLLQTKKCEYLPCGKEFPPARYWQKFCSAACRYRAWTEENMTSEKIKQMEHRLKKLESMLKSKVKENENVRRETGDLISPKAARVGDEEPDAGTLPSTDGDEGAI